MHELGADPPPNEPQQSNVATGNARKIRFGIMCRRLVFPA